MLMEQLPNCVCGARAYGGGGGQYGGEFAQSNFRCTACQRPVMAIESALGVHAFFPTGEVFTSADFTYLNGPFATTRRSHEARVKKEESRLYEERQLTHKHVTARLGIPESTSYYDLPEGVRKDIDPKRDQLRRDAWALTPPLPPQLPLSLRVLVKNDDRWIEVDHGASAQLEVPRDPIAVHHEEYWGGIFAELEKKLGPLPRKTIPNGYDRDENGFEPWYAFERNGLHFTVGPRKRVDAIHVRSSNKPIVVARIAALAKADNVTYSADGGWHNFDAKPQHIEVHAWSKEKLIEYLTVIFEEN